MTDHPTTAKPAPPALEIIAETRAFRERTEKDRRERLEATNAESAALLGLLRNAGVTDIAAEYDGQGDSGNVEELDIRPPSASAAIYGETVRRLDAFVWDLAYSTHPGFEINDGGFGTLTWRRDEDSIDIEHNERVVELETTHHEGI